MLFAWLKFVQAWAAPLPACCVLMLFGVVFAGTRPRLARALTVLGLGVLWALATGSVAERLAAPLERAFRRPLPSARAEAVVVLGGILDLAQSTPDRVEFSDRPERLLEAIRLWREGRVKRLVLSGGSRDPLRPAASEADLLAGVARRLGVPDSALLIQRGSRTTAEDARLTGKLLRERGLERFFLVTSALHMPRAVGSFRKVGLAPVPFPVDFRTLTERRRIDAYTPNVAALSVSSDALHEYLGYLGYRLTGAL